MENQISKNNEFFQLIKQYKKHPKNEYYVVEELFILEMCLKYPCEVIGLLYCDELCYSDNVKTMINKFKTISKDVYQISKKTYNTLAEKENASGMIALIKKEYVNLNDITNEYEKVLVLDSIEIPGNVGTMVRTSDATDFDLVIMVNKVTGFSHHKAISSSRGMFLKVPFACVEYQEAQDYLLNNNYNIYLGEPILGKAYNEYNYEGKTAIVVGNERYGINSKWYDNKHKKVFIPMFGEMTSLNVSIAGSILMYEVKMKKELLNK